MGYCIVLDTETTGLDKCFCYDISWVVMDKSTGAIVDFKTNVVEQVWHNLPLFESAYYKEKRQKWKKELFPLSPLFSVCFEFSSRYSYLL